MRGRAYRRAQTEQAKARVRPARGFHSIADDPTPREIGIAARTPDRCGACGHCAPHKFGWEDRRTLAEKRFDISAREQEAAL